MKVQTAPKLQNDVIQILFNGLRKIYNTILVTIFVNNKAEHIIIVDTHTLIIPIERNSKILCFPLKWHTSVVCRRIHVILYETCSNI